MWNQVIWFVIPNRNQLDVIWNKIILQKWYNYKVSSTKILTGLIFIPAADGIPDTKRPTTFRNYWSGDKNHVAPERTLLSFRIRMDAINPPPHYWRDCKVSYYVHETVRDYLNQRPTYIDLYQFNLLPCFLVSTYMHRLMMILKLNLSDMAVYTCVSLGKSVFLLIRVIKFINMSKYLSR